MQNLMMVVLDVVLLKSLIEIEVIVINSVFFFLQLTKDECKNYYLVD